MATGEIRGTQGVGYTLHAAEGGLGQLRSEEEKGDQGPADGESSPEGGVIDADKAHTSLALLAFTGLARVAAFVVVGFCCCPRCFRLFGMIAVHSSQRCFLVPAWPCTENQDRGFVRCW